MLDEILTPRGWRGSFTCLLQICEGSLCREATQGINQHGIRLGHIETDIRNLVRDKSIQDGEDRVLDDVQRNNGCESLDKVSKATSVGTINQHTEMVKHVVILYR